jgi:hypothetical protein
MKICELFEDQDQNLKMVNAVLGSTITVMYHELNQALDRSSNLAAFPLVAGSRKARWFQQFWRGSTPQPGQRSRAEPGIFRPLFLLAKQNPQASVLKHLLDFAPTSYSQLVKGDIFTALVELAELIKRKQPHLSSAAQSLKAAAKRWEQLDSQLTNRFIEMQEEEKQSQEPAASTGAASSSPAQSKNSELLRKQQQQREQMINQVLSGLVKNKKLTTDQAHAIRQSISRTDNPLLALQAQLNKLNIS